MKLHIYRYALPDAIEIGDVVLWENDIPIEVESITRTKDGFELTGHNRHKPGFRAITMRPKGEQLRVLPSNAQALALLAEMTVVAVSGGWAVEEINDLKPLVLRGPASTAPTVSNGKVGGPVTADISQSTPTVDANVS